MNSTARAVVVQRGEGRALHAFGDVLTVLLGGEQTGGNLTVMFDETPPGGGPPLHRHLAEDELFLVVEGRISYFANDCWTELTPGGAVYMPRGTVHCYRNTGETPSKQWILTTPAGFENFFARCAEEFCTAGGPRMDQIERIHHEHNIELLGMPPAP